VKVAWTSKAVGDLARLHDFLATVNRRAAARVLQTLTAVASRLLDQPRIGEKLEQYEPREVRRVLVGSYEMRYETQPSGIFILRVWQAREDR
jgi:plasmid stabilization system protein ParE